ncbi:MAG: response regulator [Gammaproteobacteria bacterium]|nr:MAG: response regulator [Gammaproteobacteria bacterium]
MRARAQAPPAEVLLVEDNPADARLTREALREAGLRGRIHVVEDGVGALGFLRREGAYARAPRPDLVLLDLNLPRKDGREVLREIKADPELRSIPVVVLTTSCSEEDVLLSYQLHANCYVTKPADLDQFLETLRSLQGFWLRVARLPRR